MADTKTTKFTYYYKDENGNEIKARTSSHVYKYAHIRLNMYANNLEKLKQRIHADCCWLLTDYRFNLKCGYINKYDIATQTSKRVPFTREMYNEKVKEAEQNYNREIKTIVEVYTK